MSINGFLAFAPFGCMASQFTASEPARSLGVIDAQMTVHLGIFGSRAVVWTARKYAWKAHRKNGPKNHTYARKYGGVVRVTNPEPP